MSRSGGDAPVRASVIIPAHDEESVIGRCLDALLRGAHPEELEVVVVCNGCSDGTAAVARAHAPTATVREIGTASKPAALNAGDEIATRFPRFYVDADVELPLPVLREMARPLAEERYRYAAPAARFVSDNRPATVRSFFAVWDSVSRARDEPAGKGAYGLSAQGRARFTRFPTLIADDQFVVQQFAPPERLTLVDGFAIVYPPTTLGGLVRTRVRVYRGNHELAGSALAPHPPAPGALRALLTLARRPRSVLPVVVYVTVNVIARLLARMPQDGSWARDDTSRLAPSEGLSAA